MTPWKSFGIAGIVCAAACAPVGVQAQPAAGGKTLVKVNMVKGYVTLYVNGKKLDRVGKASLIDAGAGIKDIDLNPYVKPGSNTLRVVWQEQKAPAGSVTVGYAPPGTAFRALGSVNLNPANSKPSGEKNITFTVPKPGTNQSVNADSSASGKVAPGSHPNQTLLVSNISNSTTATVYVNEKKVGSFSSGLLRLDISDYVRFGENKVRMAWATGKAPQGTVGVSYAVQPSQFRTLTEITLNPVTVKANEKGRALTFQLPKP